MRDFAEIRRHTIIALFSDDFLLNRLVLKGGNALEIAHDLVHRGSVDLDFSIPDEFKNLDEIRRRMRRALVRHFNTVGYRVFDFSLVPKPSERSAGLPRHWGGYLAEFKLIDLKAFSAYRDKPDVLQRNALEVAPRSKRTFKIDISMHEYCEGKQAVCLGENTIYVYSVEMIVAEKLRALCQQMDVYPHGRGIFSTFTRLSNSAVLTVEVLRFTRCCIRYFPPRRFPSSCFRALPTPPTFTVPTGRREDLAGQQKTLITTLITLLR